MLEIALTPKSLGPQRSGALGLSHFSLMVNPRLNLSETCSFQIKINDSCFNEQHVQNAWGV